MRMIVAILAVVVCRDVYGQARPQRDTGAGADTSKAYFEFQVDQPAEEVRNSIRPAYPQALKRLRAEGQVTVQFVVDTTGFAEAETARVVRSSHPLFSAAVMTTLPGMQYVPAELRGRKVKQVVVQRFTFTPPK